MLKTKSFKTRLMMTVIGLVMVSTLVVDAIGVGLIYQVSVDDATQLAQKIESENVTGVNAILDNAERSTITLYNYIFGALSNGINLEDDAQRKEHLEDVRPLAVNIAENTKGSISVFYRFDKYADYTDEGIFLGLSGKDFVDLPLLDINNYDPTDVEHVGWYYKPIAAGKPTWVEPCYDEALNRDVISYCAPIYISNTFVGLVGMNVDLNVIRDATAAISAYKTGYGFLLQDDNDVIYHPDYPKGAFFDEIDKQYQVLFKTLDSNRYVIRTERGKVNNDEVWVTYQTLANGMVLGTLIREREILAPINQFILRAVLFIVIVILLAILFAILLIRTLTKPLNELTIVAEEVAAGNMQVSISMDTDDEFGKLAHAFRSMRDEIVKSFAYMNGLAYSDVMTGVNNKGAFERDSEGVTQTCLRHNEEFAVVVADINGLKDINDSLGHIVGDELIKGIAFELVKVFGKRNTYRTGGDEFCVLIRGTTEKEVLDGISHFEEGVRDFSNQNQSMFHRDISAATGYSFFDPQKDSDFSDVYSRADDYMYRKKTKMKVNGTGETASD